MNDDFELGKQYKRHHVLCANGVWVPILTSGLQSAKPALGLAEGYLYIDKRFVPPEIYKMLDPGIAIIFESVILKIEQKRATFCRLGLSSSLSQSVSDVLELEALRKKEALSLEIDQTIHGLENTLARLNEFVID